MIHLDINAQSVIGNRELQNIFAVWLRMLNRCCYKSEFVHDLLHEDWHNFHGFYEWHENNYPYDVMAMHFLSLIPGAKIWGPDTCVFVSDPKNCIREVEVQDKHLEAYNGGNVIDTELGRVICRLAENRYGELSLEELKKQAVKETGFSQEKVVKTIEQLLNEKWLLSNGEYVEAF
jgi:hypothetical protein